MPRTFRQTHHDTQSQIFFLKTLPKIIQKISFCSSDYMLHPSPPPPSSPLHANCMHMTESVSFTSCLINNTVLCHSTLLCANFTPLYAPLRYFTPLYATLRYFTVFRQTPCHGSTNSNSQRNTKRLILIEKKFSLQTLLAAFSQ